MIRDWEEEEDPPPLPRRTVPRDPLLVPLAEAVEALTRLDARTEVASEAVREGCIAALAFREAAGMLAAAHAWVHPRDLALREQTLTGAFDAAARSGAASAALPNTLPAADAGTMAGWGGDDLAGLVRDEAAVPAALHLARLLRRLPRRRDPLAGADTAAPLLVPLGGGAGLDPAAFLRWRSTLPPVVATARVPLAVPPLLAAAAAARSWMEAAIVPHPTPAQALAVAALRLASARIPAVIPLVAWSGWPGIGRPYQDGLPRVRSGLVADGAGWEADFLRLVAESARAGLRELDRLGAAEATGRALAAQSGARSRLGAAVEAVLREPALTPKALAGRIGVTHQAALRLLAVLAQAGVVAEITGRRSFRAFSVL